MSPLCAVQLPLSQLYPGADFETVLTGRKGTVLYVANNDGRDPATRKNAVVRWEDGSTCFLREALEVIALGTRTPVPRGGNKERQAWGAA